ncbi:hypothetical protein R5R35_006110 [Gryllus longicercus]|uniref:Uncharacterized protein n=1 Tax=Gryllus longicercus TaxID=2509291 RepID=A0AAN9ZET8_9ORTH
MAQLNSLKHTDHFPKGLYSSILPCHSWDHGENVRNATHGGVFNLEFSPDGSLLVAACEKKSILMFDPLCKKLIHAVDNAHLDCVNCVRFLDSKVFATCSDDSTVALWDARNLKSQIRTLRGHSNWVKYIEFSSRDGLLVTSGFDGNILTWDTNSYSENGYNRVFQTNGLMGTRLHSDASKMIISTTGGYLMIVHNLNLNMLAQDLNGFKPNMYRLMQLSQTEIPLAAEFTHLFSQQRKINRVELISDFLKGDDAEVISYLQIHPQGWCAMSRNISNDGSSEWTCIHDIQEREYCAGESEAHSKSENEPYVDSLSQSRDSSVQDRDGNSVGDVGLGANSSANVELNVSSVDEWEALKAIREARIHREREQKFAERAEQERYEAQRAERMRPKVTIPMYPGNLGRTESEQTNSDESSRIANSNKSCNNRNNNSNNNSSSGSVEWMQGRVVVRRNPDSNVPSSEGSNRADGSSNGSVHFSSHLSGVACNSISHQSPKMGFNFSDFPKLNCRIHQNIPRLTHYIEEQNVGEGFIKVSGFSADGRLICSPFGHGVRLLAFPPECSEFSVCHPDKAPVPLHELATNVSHNDIVVCTKFSPQNFLLVSGCLSGKIVWHQPIG